MNSSIQSDADLMPFTLVRMTDVVPEANTFDRTCEGIAAVDYYGAILLHSFAKPRTIRKTS
jgi:hypothetical protein